jgi:hypothetical protein
VNRVQRLASVPPERKDGEAHRRSTVNAHVAVREYHPIGLNGPACESHPLVKPHAGDTLAGVVYA